jgi:co-chaperonin GroES (HSP10)
MQNKSGIKPFGRAVLIKPYTPERKESVIVMPDEVLQRDQMVEQRAIVVEVGKFAWHDEPEPRACAGQKVLVSKFAGYMVKGTADNEQYRLVNDKDIFAGIEVES